MVVCVSCPVVLRVVSLVLLSCVFSYMCSQRRRRKKSWKRDLTDRFREDARSAQRHNQNKAVGLLLNLLPRQGEGRAFQCSELVGQGNDGYSCISTAGCRKFVVV